MAGTTEAVDAARAMIENGSVTQEHALPVRERQGRSAPLDDATTEDTEDTRMRL
jgi:hypothetical protein